MLVGDVAGNAKSIVAAAERACGELHADLLVLPELTLSGYPPEDLLFHRGFRVAIEKGLATVRAAQASCGVVVGFPEYAGAQIFNSAALIESGEVARHASQELPAQLQGLRREALFQVGRAADRGRLPRLSHRPPGLRGHLGTRARAARALGGRRDVRRPQRVTVRNPQAAQPRGHRAAAACAISVCRSCTSTCWAVRTNWCSTAIRS